MVLRSEIDTKLFYFWFFKFESLLKILFWKLITNIWKSKADSFWNCLCCVSREEQTLLDDFACQKNERWRKILYLINKKTWQGQVMVLPFSKLNNDVIDDVEQIILIRCLLYFFICCENFVNSFLILHIQKFIFWLFYICLEIQKLSEKAVSPTRTFDCREDFRPHDLRR